MQECMIQHAGTRQVGMCPLWLLWAHITILQMAGAAPPAAPSLSRSYVTDPGRHTAGHLALKS